MSNSSPDVQGFAFIGDGHQTAKQTVKVIRTGLIIGAILSALFGVLILTATGQVLEVVAVLFGIYFIVRGAVRFGTGLFSGAFGGAARALNIIIGLLLLVVGVLAVFHPVIKVSIEDFLNHRRNYFRYCGVRRCSSSP